MDLRESTIQYEAWLRQQLAGDLVDEDLQTKHDKMKQSAFVFLRGTYWRWAETILELCPELSNAPRVLGVGDIHIENFGTWRDVDGRLIWGVNDFDEAAEMPFTIDLVRLSVSAFLGRNDKRAALEPFCNAILEGYNQGLDTPQPFVLDRDHRWMREIFVASEEERTDFWEKIDGGRKAGEYQPGPRYMNALLAAMPDTGVKMKVRRRIAGTGSLGRPRWVALAEWKGGPVVREAKAVVPSAWGRVPGRTIGKIVIMEIAQGRYRAADPWYQLTRENVIVRRLSPSARKIEGKKNRELLLEGEMLKAMGHELANIHLGAADSRVVIEQDLNRRADRWLVHAAETAADATKREFKQWKKD